MSCEIDASLIILSWELFHLLPGGPEGIVSLSLNSNCFIKIYLGVGCSRSTFLGTQRALECVEVCFMMLGVF